MTNGSRSRPLSPHLQIYKPIPTMVMSIVHRITGGALYVGTILVALWLVAAASGPAEYDWMSWLFGTILGKLVLFGYTWALIHHMIGGVKHLAWDLGHGYEKRFATKIAKLSLVASVAITLLIWVVGLLVRL